MTAHGNGQSDKANDRPSKSATAGAGTRRRRVGARSGPLGSTVVDLNDHVAARPDALAERSALPAEHSAKILFFTGVQILRDASSDR